MSIYVEFEIRKMVEINLPVRTRFMIVKKCLIYMDLTVGRSGVCRWRHVHECAFR